MSGYFFSPSFPGFYFDDIFCRWRIIVPDRNIIRLTFQEFRLKDHPTCEKCSLEIFDGRDETAPAIGRFCGYNYPPVFVSSSNHFTIVLRCFGKPPIASFKAFYQSVAGMLRIVLWKRKERLLSNFIEFRFFFCGGEGEFCVKL